MVLPFAGGVSPQLSVFSLLFSVSYPQTRRSYYLFFSYLFFNYLYGVPVWTYFVGGRVPVWTYFAGAEYTNLDVENWPE